VVGSNCIKWMEKCTIKLEVLAELLGSPWTTYKPTFTTCMPKKTASLRDTLQLQMVLVHLWLQC
jgi:hypothetical protein